MFEPPAGKWGQAGSVHNGHLDRACSTYGYLLCNLGKSHKELHLPPRFVCDLLHRREQILHHRAAAEILFGGNQHPCVEIELPVVAFESHSCDAPERSETLIGVVWRVRGKVSCYLPAFFAIRFAVFFTTFLAVFLTSLFVVFLVGFFVVLVAFLAAFFADFRTGRFFASRLFISLMTAFSIRLARLVALALVVFLAAIPVPFRVMVWVMNAGKA